MSIHRLLSLLMHVAIIATIAGCECRYQPFGALSSASNNDVKVFVSAKYPNPYEAPVAIDIYIIFMNSSDRDIEVSDEVRIFANGWTGDSISLNMERALTKTGTITVISAGGYSILNRKLTFPVVVNPIDVITQLKWRHRGEQGWTDTDSYDGFAYPVSTSDMLMKKSQEKEK